MHRRLTLALVTALSPLTAQTLPEGYASHVEPLPSGAGSVVVLPQGMAWFTGSDLVLRENGQTRSLLHFPQPVFGSFTLPVDPETLLFGENSTGDLWLVPLRGAAAPRVIANVPFNYDALMYAPGLALISAKTGGFAAAANDVVALDLQVGAVTPLISVPGASGPLEQDEHGNLYYATVSNSFPPAPGATDVLQWPGTRLLSGLGTTVWTEQDARVLHRGLDAASDIALDGDGDLLFVDWVNGTVGEVDDLGSGRPAGVLADYSGLAEQPVTLQYLPARGRGVFEPFQPATGGSLVVLEASFGATSRLRQLTPRRPRARPDRPGPVPAGPFQVLVENGPAQGAGILALHLFAAGREVPLVLPGFEQPLFWDLALFGAANTHLLSFDGQGRAALGLTNPGFAGGLQIAVQAAFLDAGGVALGSSPATAVLLAQ